MLAKPMLPLFVPIQESGYLKNWQAYTFVKCCKQQIATYALYTVDGGCCAISVEEATP